MNLDAIMDRAIAAWNAHDPDAVAAGFADGSVYWSPTLPATDATGPEGARADAAMLFTAFPDFTLTERERVVSADGRRGSLWWDVTGTVSGPLDPPGFAPTNGPITNHGVTWVETDGDRIARFHLYFDVNELGRQIGAIPPPGSAGEKMVVTFQRLTAKGHRKRDWSN